MAEKGDKPNSLVQRATQHDQCPKVAYQMNDITVTSEDFRHLKIGDKSFKCNGAAYEAADGQIVQLTGLPRPPFEKPKPPPGPNRKQRRAARSKRGKSKNTNKRVQRALGR